MRSRLRLPRGALCTWDTPITLRSRGTHPITYVLSPERANLAANDMTALSLMHLCLRTLDCLVHLAKHVQPRCRLSRAWRVPPARVVKGMLARNARARGRSSPR